MTSTERITLPKAPDDVNATLGRLFDQLAAKRRRNILRASYYDGKRAAKQVGTLIPPHYYHLGIVLGWSAKAVDTLALRCNSDGFVWPGGDLDSLGMGKVAEENQLGAEISSGMVSSLIHGVSFLVNTSGEGNEPESLIHAKDALSATGEWNDRRRHLDNLLSITGREKDGKVTSFALYLDGITYTAEKSGGVWSWDASEHPWGVPVEALVYKPRVGRPFGMSRISRPVMSLNDQALRTVIRMEGHADVHSFPEMWMLGADGSHFKNPDGTQKVEWQVMLGRIKGLPDDEEATNPRADVKQFAASSPIGHIDMLKQQAQLFSGETSIPLSSLGVSDMSNPTSADSYIASREDLIAAAEGATDDWTPPLRRSVVRALAIAGGLDEVPEKWATIQPKWRSPLYLSRSAQADAGLKTLTAAPWLAETEVGLELLGLSEQQIERAMADRRRMGGSAALRQISQAAQATKTAQPAQDAQPDSRTVTGDRTDG